MAKSAKTDMNAVYKRRRADFMRKLGDGCALIYTAPHFPRNGDNEFDFRPDSYFHYLTGFDEPEAAALFAPKSSKPFTLYVRERDKHKEHWYGVRAGTQGAVRNFGADQAFAIEELAGHLAQHLRQQGTFYYSMGIHRQHDDQVARLLADYKPNQRAGDKPLAAIRNPMLILDEMRAVKDSAEVAIMQRAADISEQAYDAVLKGMHNMHHEYEVEALIEYTSRHFGAVGQSFPSIIAGGENATILHYNTNNAPLKRGDLLLIDTGVEYNYYASDVTRTIPVSGKFSKPQREIYEVVLAAQLAVIDMARPGVRYDELQLKSREILSQGLIKLGLLKGSVAENVKGTHLTQYYTHRIGHWLGMDVHDVGRYFEADGSAVALAPGMVMTIEPGLYFGKHDKSVPAAYRGIGVRIEDNILVTKNGCRVLTAAIPKTVADIESRMRG